MKINGKPVLKGFLMLLCAGGLMLGGCGKSTDQGSEMTAGSFETDKSPEATTAFLDPNQLDIPDDPEEYEKMTKEEKKRARLDKQRYQDATHLLQVLGLKSYKKIKNDDTADKPEEGKVYLVLFLSFWNSSNERIFFNPYQLTASADGKTVENTALFNQPEGYPTIFANAEPDETILGYVAWQVPKDWKKLHVEYKGFDPEKDTPVKMDFTNEDTLTPDVYKDPMK